MRLNIGFKWEPIALMLLVLGLGMWLVIGPINPKPRPGSEAIELRVGNAKGVIEITRTTATDTTPTEPRFRVLLRDGFASEEMSESQFRQTFGDAVTDAALADASNPIFKLFKITSWVNLAWVALGLSGQIAFSGRMVLQWLVSEKKRESVIPESFWWLSLFGGLALFAYFVWRQDFVGVLGQSSGIVIYARNIRLIHKRRRRDLEAQTASSREDEPASP